MRVLEREFVCVGEGDKKRVLREIVLERERERKKEREC
jgi:hypothetical protein